MAGRGKPPEWHPDGAGPEFAARIVAGDPGDTGDAGASGSTPQPAPTRPPARRRRPLTADEHVAGVLAGDRTILARTITLVESNLAAHAAVAREVVRRVLPKAGRSIRIGITGVPGVGKSTFIEAFGTMLCDQGHRVAVLAVDPSSSVSRGSILGDKTRMEKLSHHPNAFIRPSPTGGTLGGVTRRSRETIVLCEAAGFDVVLVETVGVGQSEVAVRSMVDFFLLLMLSGAGDELQGIKKGVIELADALVVNKADGDNERRAALAAREYSRALHYLAPATPEWTTEAHTCSALTGAGIPELWALVERFRASGEQNGTFRERRERQRLEWTFAMVEQFLVDSFHRTPRVAEVLPEVRREVAEGRLTASMAAEKLLRAYFEALDPAAALDDLP
jgi:LAO/AO transport system kinase